MTFYFCPEHCGICQDCKKTLEQIDNVDYDMYVNELERKHEWELTKSQAAAERQDEHGIHQDRGLME